MEHVGVVKQLDGKYAYVAVKKQSACDGCAMGSLCESSDTETSLIKAINLISAKEGDSVVVSFDSPAFITGSLLVYALPVCLMVIGAILGKLYLSAFLPWDTEGLSALGGFVFLAIGFAIVKLISVLYAKKSSVTPVIIKNSENIDCNLAINSSKSEFLR